VNFRLTPEGREFLQDLRSKVGALGRPALLDAIARFAREAVTRRRPASD